MIGMFGAGAFACKPDLARFTPAFASPEVLTGAAGRRGEWFDVRAHDVWAMGCLYAYIITGVSYFNPSEEQLWGR